MRLVIDQDVQRTTDELGADSGRLLSLSLEQEGTGTNQLPQGQVQVRQQTRIELLGS